jgi:3-carboxy-cis,cis-muconate cycloisomerase
MSALLDAVFAPEEIRRIFSDEAHLQGMLDFEAALARAEARAGVIPPAAAVAIGRQCEARLFDLGALAGAAAKAGNTAIPMVRALTAQVAGVDAEAARYVHWGATSQDAMDTGLVLQLRRLIDRVETDLARLSAIFADLAERHRRTEMAGRTWLQQAAPVTFGLKAAGWLSAVERHRQRLAELKPRLLVVQFGGAVGTLAALGDWGLSVGALLAEELSLSWPDLPWHAQRDRVAELATVLGLMVGSLGKVARDLSLLNQTEIGEASEPAEPGRGGSSAMPQKRNPVGAAVVLAAAQRAPGLVSVMLSAMPQEHERGLGNWLAEWQTLPEICTLAGGALSQLVEVAGGLSVDAERMRQNLDQGNGQVFASAVAMALAAHLGARPAHELVEKAARRATEQRRHLLVVLAEDPAVTQHLDVAELDRLFDPAGAVGLAESLVDRALAARRPSDR